MISRLKFGITDALCLLEEFLMMFEEKVLQRCWACNLPNPQHKTDCYRDYAKQVNRRG